MRSKGEGFGRLSRGSKFGSGSGRKLPVRLCPLSVKSRHAKTQSTKRAGLHTMVPLKSTAEEIYATQSL